jgi:hypothetical protein
MINDNGYVVWRGTDNVFDKIFLYDGTSTIELTDDSSHGLGPWINANNDVTWWGRDYGAVGYEIFYASRSGTANEDPEGGTITHLGPRGDVKVIIPPGALDNQTTFTITETGTDYELSTNLGNGTALYGVEIQPEGLEFNTPITIVFSWPDEDPEDGTIDGTNIKERNIIITKDNVGITGRCHEEPVDGQGAECDMDANTFTFQVDRLSVFTIFSLSTTPGGGSIAVGGTASMANKVGLLTPWIVLTTLILITIGTIVVRRSKKQS